MSIHTASTRHLVDLSVTVPGDGGLMAPDLIAIINDALSRRGYEVLAVDATEDIGLSADNAVVVLDPGSSDPTYGPLHGAIIRMVEDGPVMMVL